MAIMSENQLLCKITNYVNEPWHIQHYGRLTTTTFISSLTFALIQNRATTLPWTILFFTGIFLPLVVFLIWPEYIKLCSVCFNLVSNQYSDDKLERCQLLISSALFWRRSASPGLRLVSLFWFACHLNHNSISRGSTRENTPLQAGSNTVVDCIDWA